MNLNIVTQAVVQLKKEHCNLPNLISNSLYHTFLEQKAVHVRSFTVPQYNNPATMVNFVECISSNAQDSGSIELIAQSSEFQSIVTIVPAPLQQANLPISVAELIIKAYRVGNFRIGITKSVLYEFHSGKTFIFSEPVVKVFSAGLWNDFIQFILYHADGSLTRLMIHSKTADIQIHLCTKTSNIRSAVAINDAILYCTYEGKFTLIKTDGNGHSTQSLVRLTSRGDNVGILPERFQVSDMKWDIHNQSVYILCNKNLILKAHYLGESTLEVSVIKKLQGYYNELEVTSFGVIAKFKCNGNFSLLLKLQENTGYQELVEQYYIDANAAYVKAADKHFMVTINGPKVSIYEFRDFALGSRTISHRKFFDVYNYSQGLNGHCDGISQILPFKSSVSSEVYSFAVFMENRKGFILKMNANGFLLVYSSFDLANRIDEKAQIHLVHPISFKDSKGVEFLLLNVIEDKESSLMAFNIDSSEILNSHSVRSKLAGVKMIEDSNMLVIADGSELMFYSIDLNVTTRQVNLSYINKLEFETTITAFDFNGSTLVIADTRNSIHFFGITIKGNEIKPKYIAGDGKYRQVETVEFIDKHTVYLTTKNGITALISTQPKSIYKIDKKHEKFIVKQSPGSPFNDLLHPFLKIKTEGNSLGYFALNESQMKQLIKDFSYLETLFSQRNVGIVLDSRGKIYLCGSGLIQETYVKNGEESQKDENKLIRSFMVVSNRIAKFKRRGSIEVNALKKIKEKSLEWNPLAKVNDHANFPDGPQVLATLRTIFK